MDCCFNLFIPKSKNDLIVIRPMGKTFINGLAESYSFNDYNKEIVGSHMNKSEYERIIDSINNPLFNEFPCCGCLLFGYCCCPCTLGLSLLLPYRKVRNAHKALLETINKINR
jgi:hypothetical protein